MAKGPSKQEQELVSAIYALRYDPPNAIRFLFPWGEPGTPLAQVFGPRKWQLAVLEDLKRQIDDNLERQAMGLPPEPLYLARSSGRGIGKSALFGMIVIYVMSCFPGATVIITANTEAQLKSRTMAELGKWHTMAINSHWFEKQTMSLRPAKWYGDLVKEQLKIDTQYFYAEAQTWSEENPDAFAGAHSQIAMVLIFDEASGIPTPIWNVSEGFFTDEAELRFWGAFSNPRRNTGQFFECFHKDRAFWNTATIDSRTVEDVDKGVYQRIADKHGEDHDVTRVEVKGEFPRQGANQFISREVVQDATIRKVTPDDGAPLVIGVDVARFGDDQSIILFRKGRDCRSIPYRAFRGISTSELAGYVAAEIDDRNPDAVFIDGGGVGGGVVDILKDMGYRAIEVQAGSAADDPEQYQNKRVEMWGRMREWLTVGCIPDDQDMIDDLTGPEYKHNITKSNAIILERKDEMKKRGLASPDIGDALALTFAKAVARKDRKTSRNSGRRRMAKNVRYKVLG